MTNDNIITQEMWDSLNEELWDRRTEMTQMKIVIAQLCKERDEARREVCNCSVGVGLKATSQAVAMETKLLSLNQLAEITGLPTAWLKREADEGRIPCIRADRRRMFNLQAVLKVLTDRQSKVVDSE